MKKEPTFEEAMAQLDEIVQKLEAGSETLDASIALYETGMKLSALLNRRLEAAEQKFETLAAPKQAQDEQTKDEKTED